MFPKNAPRSKGGAASAPGPDGLRFEHLCNPYSLQQLLMKSSSPWLVGPSEGVMWRIPTHSKRNSGLYFFQPNIMAMGQECHPICFGFTMRHRLAAATFREYWPRFTELYVSEGQYGAGVSREVERVVCSQTVALHQTGNCLILLDCSSVSSFVRRADVFEDVSPNVPTRMHFVAKCYEGPADMQ